MKISTCIVTGALALVVTGAGAAYAAPILGVEAAGPVKRWFSALAGLSVEGATIAASTVTVGLAGDCELRIEHREAGGCPEPTVTGNAVVCWLGAACPADDVRAAALAAAGPITLPWRDAAAGDAANDPAAAAREATLKARQAAAEHLSIGAVDKARDVLLPLLQRKDVRPMEWLGLAPLLAVAEARAEAWRVATAEGMAELGPGLNVVLRTSLLMGAGAAASVAAAVMTADDACRYTSLSSAFVTAREYEAAGLLGHAIRELDPTCFGAWAAEVEAWSILRRTEPLKASAAAAIERFGDDPRLAPIRDTYLVAAGRGGEVQARLEAKIAAGEAEAGVLKQLLPFYIDAVGRKERKAAFAARVAANPDDVYAAFFAGVINHYERDFATSQKLLRPVIGKVADEPRLYIYLAMNAFNLGDRAEAEDFISRAARLDDKDPDVPYCLGEIFRDSDRSRATKALDRYWSMTQFTSDAGSRKQQRVAGMRLALAKCVADKTPPPCPGPWEHYFDSVRAERERRAQLLADTEAARERRRENARLKKAGRGGVGKGGDGADAPERPEGGKWKGGPPPGAQGQPGRPAPSGGL